MNRRAFFATLTAACAIPAISEMRKRQERWAILRLRDELSVKIREANSQLKAMRLRFEETNKEPIYFGEIVMGEKSK
jgi:hypothetical protein